MNKPLAVFDCDGTKFKSSCVEKVVDIAINQGLFSPEPFAQAFAKRRLWQANNNEGVYQSYLHHLVGGFVTSIAGVRVENFQAITDQMIAEHRVRLYSYPQHLARLLKATHTLVAISGSPIMVVEPFLEGLGFDQVIGSSFEVKDGYFTGVAQGIDKERALTDLVASTDMIDVGIGDTVSDIPVLRRAQCAIAFNPSATLQRAAIGQGWFMVHEFKDSVTQFLPGDEGYSAVFDRSPTIILDAAGIKL